MNRRLTDSPDKSLSFNRLAVPTNHWQTRNTPPLNQSTATADNSLRAVVPNQFSTLGPNFGNQRFFTPRSSYFGQQNDKFVFSASAVNMNSNYGSNYEFNSQQSGVHSPYDISESNRPVFSTDLSNIKLDTDLVKTALFNASQLSETGGNKPDSTESTSSSGDEKPKTINELVAQMKNLRKQEIDIKNHRRDIDRKLEQLDEELKEYERKLNFKETLKKIKSDLEKSEELVGNNIQTVLSLMDKITKNPNLSSVELINDLNNKSIVEKSDTNVDKSVKKKIQSTASSLPKPALKRLNPSVTKTNPTKKVRINAQVVDSSGGSSKLSSAIDTTPKQSTKPVIRKSPFPQKLAQSSGTPEVDSPKINRICKQQTPKPSTGLSSGVKTSRPQKIMGSTKRFGSFEQNKEPPAPTVAPKVTQKVTPAVTPTAQKTTENTPKKLVLTEEESDKDVFKELEKSSSKIDDSIKQSNQTSDMTSVTPVSDVSQIKTVRVEEQTTKPDDTSIINTVIDNKQTEKHEISVNRAVQVFDIDSDESSDQETTTIGENQKKIIKEEANNLLSEESTVITAMSITSRNSSISSNSSETSEEQYSGKESSFKVPAEPASVKRKTQYKYSGLDPIYYEPTVPYVLKSFKAIAGPKSKTSVSSIISLKQFQNYIFASFMDSTVRRYHIENGDVVKFEGHEGLVMAMIIIECPKNMGTYILYTGAKDKKVRAFNAITGQILNSVVLNDEISCMIFSWSHIFCALKDGSICRLSTIHENNDTISNNSDQMKYFVVNAKKRIHSIIAVNTVEPIDNDFEAVVAVSSNKLRVVNTKDSVDDSLRVLHSLNFQFCFPIYTRTYKNILILSFKMPDVKNEDKIKKPELSRIIMFDLLKDWIPIRTIDVKGLITSLDLCKNELFVSCFSGRIQCIDCDKLELKWLTYASRVTASVMIGDRLVLGDDQGMIDVIYVDQTLLHCETCGVPFARQIDFKKHIKSEHKTKALESPKEEQQK